MGLRSYTGVEVWCDGCQAEPEGIHTVGTNQIEVIRTIRSIGWSFGGGVVKCPRCRQRPRTEEEDS